LKRALFIALTFVLTGIGSTADSADSPWTSQGYDITGYFTTGSVWDRSGCWRYQDPIGKMIIVGIYPHYFAAEDAAKAYRAANPYINHGPRADIPLSHPVFQVPLPKEHADQWAAQSVMHRTGSGVCKGFTNMWVFLYPAYGGTHYASGNPPPQEDKDGDGNDDWNDTYAEDLDWGFDLGSAQVSIEPKICLQCLVSNPVSVVNGNNLESREDIRFASTGNFPFSLKTTYNSQSNSDGSLGQGWTHSYSLSLESSTVLNRAYYLRITDETGRGIYFTDAGSGLYQGAFTEKTTVNKISEEYVWHRKDGRDYTFDANGRLKQITDSIGNIIDLAYDPDGRLDAVTDTATGRAISFHYNTDGRISHITGPVTAAVSDGIWVSFGYDAAGNMKTVTYEDGSGFEYLYEDPNDPHNLTEKRNLANHVLASWTYDTSDRVISSFTPDGQGVTIDYDAPGGVAVTDAYGVTKTYTVGTPGGRKTVTNIDVPAGCSTCSRDVRRLDYDSNRRIVEAEYQNDLINRYADYDSRGNPRTVTTAVGTPDEKIVTYTFHPELNEKLTKTEPSVLGAGNKVTIWDYDDDGNAVPNENPTNLVRRIVEQGFTTDGTGSAIPYEYVTVLTYNGKGQVLSIDGPLSGSVDLTAFGYDPVSGDLTSTNLPEVGTTAYADYDEAGKPGRVTDPNGNATTFTYDGKGRVLTVKDDATGDTTTFAYNTAGDISQIVQPNGVTAHYTYDPVYGRLERITDSLGNYMAYSYDAQGNRIEESFYNPTGERQFWMRFNFQGPDRPGELWKQILPDESFTQFGYDASGNVSSIIDPETNQTTYQYDALNRLIGVIQPGEVGTGYTYDLHDNLATVTDAESHTTEYTYDDMGRKVRTVSPDTGITKYTYDAAGNLATKTDNKGITVAYSYDDLSRLTAVAFPDAFQNIFYTYDQGTNGIGRLTTMTDPSGTTSYTYDAKGNLTAEARTIDGITYTTGYRYDEAGLLASITYPDGKFLEYLRDAAGRVSQVLLTEGDNTRIIADGIAYKPFGPMSRLTFGNGLSDVRQFDLQYRLTDKTAGTAQNLDYSYAPAGNITAITDHQDPSQSKTFSYDQLYRLTSAEGPYGKITYRYDDVGNRLKRIENDQIDDYFYIGGTNRLREIVGANPVSFDYDPNGNTITMGNRTLAYNQNNRLNSVTEDGETLGEYVYNGNGQRIKKTTADGVVIFHYDQFGNIIGESAIDGTFTANYIYLDGQRIAAVAGIAVTEVTVKVNTSKDRSLSGVRVYVFNEAGSYTGLNATTDVEGIARFAIEDFSEGSYQFRVDYLSAKFWSEVVSIPNTSKIEVTIEEEDTTVQVLQGDGSEPGVKVYLFSESGAYLGLYEVTDENGTVSFLLPAEQEFKFRADFLGGKFFSDPVKITAGVAHSINLDAGGGTLTIALDQGDGISMEGTKVYLFSETGAYLGRSGTTDHQGKVFFDVPSGVYKIRADYLGYQFWTEAISMTGDTDAELTIDHVDVVISLLGDNNGGQMVKEGVKVYLFSESGAYQSQVKVTDVLGKVVFSLPDRAYKVRADFMGQQFWSEPFIQTDAEVIIEEGLASITVTRLNQSLYDVPVYVFSDSGAYLGLNQRTDGAGRVYFQLPKGDYNFRADYLGSQYFTGNTSLIAHKDNGIKLSTGGGNFTLTLTKGLYEPMEGVKCYLFSAAGSYLGHQTTTSGDGEAPFELADGFYKIRVDYMGYQFWTNEFSVPVTSELTLEIPHQDVAISVQTDYNGDLVPLESVKMHLFTAGGAYQGQYRVTGESGGAVFRLPPEDYKVRVDYLGQQFWSEVFNQADTIVVIEEGIAAVSVSQDATHLENVSVYVFSGSDSYLGIVKKTDASGGVEFRLPKGTYKFRADFQGSQYWATETLAAHENDNIVLSTGGGTFTLIVEKALNDPLIDIPVYVFSQAGSYLGINGRTDEKGQVRFDLSDGGYQFRVDYLGYRFWSNICTVPAMLSDVLTIPHHDVAVTVNQAYQGVYTPLETIKVYVFNEGRAYQGVFGTTDDRGEVSFSLPEQGYSVRADYLGEKYWSDPITPQMDQIVSVDIPHGQANVHVTDSGIDVVNAIVYLFAENGSYLGRYETTDGFGNAGFTIPEGTYKFRVDYSGSQYWSDVINIISDEETQVQMRLDLLALNLTNNPLPDRIDGIPPEIEPILLASLFDIQGILSNAVVSATKTERIFYYINDHLGTPKKIIGESSQIVWEASYKPFGEVTLRIEQEENDFRFPGQYYDQETVLHYNYHRYYDSMHGRYLRADPIGLIGLNPNFYGYSQDDPINLIDPFGLRASHKWHYERVVECIHQFERVISACGDCPSTSCKKNANEYFANCLANIERVQDLNGDGKVDAWDEMLWFTTRRLWDLLTPPFTPYPPGYGNEGPGSTNPRSKIPIELLEEIPET